VVAVAEVLGERYEFLSRIAAGGMGEVWRGRDLRLQRDVAIKVLRAEHADDPDFRARLHAEARSAGALNCDSCVDVYDYGEQTDEAGRFLSYVVMELVEGETVAQLIARDGELGPDRTARILTDTAAGLAAAERRGLVHRDIKPANLLVTSEGRVKIADFGIARAANGAAITRAGTMVGTATYVSPEQVQGDPATSASDVYSLGIVAYECLSGVIATAIARVNAPAPVLPSSVPHWLSSLVAAMLDPDPARRPSAAEIARRTRVVDTDVPVQPVAPPTAVLPVLPVLPLATTALPVAAAAAAAAGAAAETTDLAVPQSRRTAVLAAALGLAVIAVLVPTVTWSAPAPLRGVAASIVAANKANAAAAAKQRAAATRTATQGQDASTTKPVKKPKPKPKPKVKLTGRGPGGPGSVVGGPGGGRGRGHGNGRGDGDGGPGHDGDDGG
jgi:hypothetical protein